ncbi:MAG: two component transcriptional regulator, LuxR family [Acidobacteria bacterium]|nr:two component transcriptional regulator, LuxR family [Acidobacteriota bacterium]
MKSDPEKQVPTVHLVDDDPSILPALSRLLRSAGYRVEPFSSAEEFLNHRNKFPEVPGCAIVDLKLPGLSGLELQESLSKQQEPLPVIFLTGHGDIPSSVHAMKHNAVDFLTKPVSAGDLLPAVKRALDADIRAREARRQKRMILERYETLTPREREVMAWVVRGLLNKQVAFELGTTERTIKAHRAQIMAKMQVGSLAELVRISEQLDNWLEARGVL